MIDYSIIFARSARREMESLDPPIVQRIVRRIEELSRDPRPPGCKKLKGGLSLRRIRIGDYRVIYAIQDQMRVVDVVGVRHRSKAYE